MARAVLSGARHGQCYQVQHCGACPWVWGLQQQLTPDIAICAADSCPRQGCACGPGVTAYTSPITWSINMQAVPAAAAAAHRCTAVINDECCCCRPRRREGLSSFAFRAFQDRRAVTMRSTTQINAQFMLIVKCVLCW